MDGAGRVGAGWSRQSKRSKHPARSFVASEEKEEREKKRGPPRIPGPEAIGAVKIRHVQKKPALSAPHGQVPTRLTEQKVSWFRTTDKSRAGLRFHPLDRLSSLQEQAKPTRSRAPRQRQPRARAFDTGQGVERMVKRS
jgi:hypothetical protein